MIYVLPGMGATQRMYAGPWRELPHCVFLDWPVRVEAVSISDIAARVIESAAIPDGASLIGSSLGGIVACEIARLRKIERLFLVGSAKEKEEVSSVLRVLHPLIDLAPLSFVQRACGKLPSELCSMFSESDAAFVRSMCRAIFTWDGLLEYFSHDIDAGFLAARSLVSHAWRARMGYRMRGNRQKADGSLRFAVSAGWALDLVE